MIIFAKYLIFRGYNNVKFTLIFCSQIPCFTRMCIYKNKRL